MQKKSGPRKRIINLSLADGKYAESTALANNYMEQKLATAKMSFPVP